MNNAYFHTEWSGRGHIFIPNEVAGGTFQLLVQLSHRNNIYTKIADKSTFTDDIYYYEVWLK